MTLHKPIVLKLKRIYKVIKEVRYFDKPVLHIFGDYINYSEELYKEIEEVCEGARRYFFENGNKETDKFIFFTDYTLVDLKTFLVLVGAEEFEVYVKPKKGSLLYDQI